MKQTTLTRILKREVGGLSPQAVSAGFYAERAWIDELDIVNELGGHSGCVNALRYVNTAQSRPLLSVFQPLQFRQVISSYIIEHSTDPITSSAGQNLGGSLPLALMINSLISIGTSPNHHRHHSRLAPQYQPVIRRIYSL